MERLLNKKEVAQVFGVTVKAVDKWGSSRQLPFIRLSRRCVRFRPIEIKHYLDKRTVKADVRNSLKTRQTTGI